MDFFLLNEDTWKLLTNIREAVNFICESVAEKFAALCFH